MEIILLNSKTGQKKHLQRTRPLVIIVLFFFISLLVVSVYGAYQWGLKDNAGALVAEQTVRHWQTNLSQQKVALKALRQRSSRHIDALSSQLAYLKARLLRLDALGARLSAMVKLDSKEFDFTAPPAMGGPEASNEDTDAKATLPLDTDLEQVQRQLDKRSAQLDVLAKLLHTDKLSKAVALTGWPVERGWVSSHYGFRIDPFSGHRAWHAGIDLAAKAGERVASVATGIVVWAGPRHGYGNLVEVDHGNGVRTRYGHNRRVTVQVGDVVQRGQSVAEVGSTGRSTGAHVHFEVLKDGRAMDPLRQVKRHSG